MIRLAHAASLLVAIAWLGCHAPRLVFLDVVGDDAVVTTDGDSSFPDVASDAQDITTPTDALPADASDAQDTTADANQLVVPTPSCPDLAERGCRRVAVSGGTFALGTPSGPMTSPEQPDVTVSAFVIDAYEVTVARFRRFVEQVTSPYDSSGAERRFVATYARGTAILELLGTSLTFPLAELRTPCNWTDAAGSARDEHPMNCVDWREAFAFCVWDGGRLPTEAEREWVARFWRTTGPPRPYPWGSMGVGTRCDLAHWNVPTCAGMDALATRRVGDLTLSVTFGIYDLAGNVDEWMADTYLAYAPTTAPNECWGRTSYLDPVCNAAAARMRTTRGGSFLSTRDPQLLSTQRSESNALLRSPDQGFRCVR